MLMVVIRPVLVPVDVRLAWRRQFLGRMGVRPANVVGMVVAEPAMLGHEVRGQQALAVGASGA